VLDRRGGARELRGALDLAARIAAPAAVTDRLPVSLALRPPVCPTRPTVWIGADRPDLPGLARVPTVSWPPRLAAWGFGLASPIALWRLGGEPAAVTLLLRVLAGGSGDPWDDATAFAVASRRVLAWGARADGSGWRPIGPLDPGRERRPDRPRELESLLPGRAQPPPRVVLDDRAPAAVVCAAANLVARLQLGSDRIRAGSLGLLAGERGAGRADLVVRTDRAGRARLRRRRGGGAVLCGGAAGIAQLLQRLAGADPLAVLDPLEQLADRVRWPDPDGRAGRTEPLAVVTSTRAWEGDRLLAAAARAQRAPAQSVAHLEVFASEPRAQRQALAARVAALLRVDPTRVRTSPAYHQAAFWLAHDASRRLAGADLRALVLEVPRGPRERPASWAITALGGLERLASQLGVAPDLVSVTLAPAIARSGARRGFRLRADTPAGDVVLTYRPLTRPGGAWPGDRSETSGLRLHLGDGRMREIAVESDHLAAVRAYAAEVLPRALGHAGRRRSVRIELEALVSEPDGEDHLGAFSSLEELHEELYFRTHAAARAAGARVVVVPDVRVAAGEPTRLEARLVDLGSTGRAVAPSRPELVGITLPAGSGPGLELEVDGTGALARWGASPEPGRDLRPVGRRGRRWLWLPSARSSARGGAPPDPAQLCDPDRVAHQVLGLRGRPGAAAWIVGRSTLGRPMVAMAALPWSSRLGSLAKAALLHPTVLLIGGHHANEVSSTPAHLALAHDLAQGWRPPAVLVCLPMENPDGAHVHRLLARLHPTWKLHAARFNAVGEEFGGSPRPLHSPFGEARPRARLLARIGADCLVDDHGVPDHVWAQPLAGRSSPPYFPIAYTLPPGLLYVIGETTGDSRSPTPWTTAVHAAVAAAVAADPRLMGRHRTLWDAYVRYGAGLDPRAFPSHPVNGLPLQARRAATRSSQRDQPGARFPVALDLVTEVADETSQGEDLALAVRAHLAADRAILATAARAVPPVRWARAPGGGWRLRRAAVCPAPGAAPVLPGTAPARGVSRRRSSSPG